MAEPNGSGGVTDDAIREFVREVLAATPSAGPYAVLNAWAEHRGVRHATEMNRVRAIYAEEAAALRRAGLGHEDGAGRSVWLGIGLALALNAVVGLLAATLGEPRMPSLYGLAAGLRGPLLLVWMAQIVYLAPVVVTAEVLGRTEFAKGVIIGGCVTLLLVPVVCFAPPTAGRL